MKHFYRIFTLLVLSFIISIQILKAQQPGTLDSAFGTNGIVVTGFNGKQAYSLKSASQSDSKIILAGVSVDSISSILIARYNYDGSLDSTFDNDGQLDLNFNMLPDDAENMILQSDGKIVLTGMTDFYPNRKFLIVRLNNSGSLDSSFNNTGYFSTTINSAFNCAEGLAIQSDGKIVTTGISTTGVNGDFSIVRLNTDGTLDSTFNGTGKRKDDMGYDDCSLSCCIQQDGKIISTGKGCQWNDQIGLIRYNNDGTLDSSFGNFGKVKMQIGIYSSEPFGCLLTNDEKILIAGEAGFNNKQQGVLVRFNSDGTIDSTFGVNGSTNLNYIYGSGFANLWLQPDGKILAVGYVYDSIPNSHILISRFNPDGDLDLSFGDSGNVIMDLCIQPCYENLNTISLQADGKCIISGYKNYTNYSDFMVIRFFAFQGTLVGTNPNSISGISGSQVYFKVDEMYPATKFQWQTNDGSGWQNLKDSAQFSGSKTDSLIFNNVSWQNNNQQFRCLLNCYGVADTSAIVNFSITSPSGINSINNSVFNLIIMPNPVRNTFDLTYTLKSDERISISIIDQSGKLIKNLSQNIFKSSGTHRESLSLPENLTIGNYSLVIQTATSNSTVKFQKK